MNTRCVCINLLRRPNRKQTMLERTQGLQLDFYNAVDGTTLEITEDIKKIFQNNTFNWRLGIIGCAMSHITLWKELVNGQHDYYFILEDDTELHPNFLKIFPQVINTMKTQHLGFVFLGHHYSNFQNYNFDMTRQVVIQPLDKRRYGGSTGGYIISKDKAVSLLEWIHSKGCTTPIDDEIIRWNDMTQSVFTCEPHIIKNLIGGDSDVQIEFPRAEF